MRRQAASSQRRQVDAAAHAPHCAQVTQAAPCLHTMPCHIWGGNTSTMPLQRHHGRSQRGVGHQHGRKWVSVGVMPDQKMRI
eukprot:SAG31_NODE_1341_length_8708_cov_10.945174_7_plen_82_part_00